VARVLAIVTDLMLGSRVTTALQGAGHEVTQVTEVPKEAGEMDLIVADLDTAEPAKLAELGVPVIGFHQHTDIETRKQAGKAGLTLAVPRSRMVRELPELVERALKSGQ
jgi:hypothetical protein